MSTPLKLKSSNLLVKDPNFSPIIDISDISTTTTNNDSSKDVDYDPSFEQLSESETWSGQEDFVPDTSSMNHMKMQKVCWIHCFGKLNVKDVDCDLGKW